MSLDAFVSILVMYGLVSCGSLAVLVWAFRGAFHASGRLFLLSEVFRIPSLISLGMLHLDPSLNVPVVPFIINGFYLAAEIIFAFSLYALATKSDAKYLPIAILFSILLSGALEITRAAHPGLPLPVYLVTFGSVSLLAFLICHRTTDRGLRNTHFWNILKYIEGTFFLISAVRLIFLAESTRVTPMHTETWDFVLVSVMLSLLIFRSFSYQAVWMSWPSLHAKENRLNGNLLSSIRERNQLLQKLGASNRRLGANALAGSLVHQLSQPLTGAALQAEAVKLKMQKQEPDSQAVKGILAVTNVLDDLSGLVCNLRSLFTGNDHKLERLSFTALCDEVIRLARFSEAASTVTIRKSGQACGEITGNRVQLQQVVVNLIVNAIEAMAFTAPEKRFVDVVLSEDASRVGFVVRDHGPGFPPEILAAPFDMYQTTKQDGTGIGLWLCEQIVKRHHGSIAVANHPEGGACVEVQLPVANTLP